MINETDIGALIKQLAELRGWSDSHASRMASGSGDTLERLGGGMSLTMRRAKAIIERCAELWPEEALWPDKIPHPSAEETPTERDVA